MNDYEQGKADCSNGIGQQSESQDYLAGYADQYALEQAASNQQEEHEAWVFQF